VNVNIRYPRHIKGRLLDELLEIEKLRPGSRRGSALRGEHRTYLRKLSAHYASELVTAAEAREQVIDLLDRLAGDTSGRRYTGGDVQQLIVDELGVLALLAFVFNDTQLVLLFAQQDRETIVGAARRQLAAATVPDGGAGTVSTEEVV
jgi:hypothetical protein